jgi:hypothetical protein
MLRNAGTILRDNGQPDGIIGGLAKERNALRTGQNSGYQSLGLGIAAGGTRHVLCGYDMKFRPGLSHWHGGHHFNRMSDDGSYRHNFTKHFRDMKLPAGVEVLNASPDSALACYPFVRLEDVL